jgi:hypothetical protein
MQKANKAKDMGEYVPRLSCKRKEDPRMVRGERHSRQTIS